MPQYTAAATALAASPQARTSPTTRTPHTVASPAQDAPYALMARLPCVNIKDRIAGVPVHDFY